MINIIKDTHTHFYELTCNVSRGFFSEVKPDAPCKKIATNGMDCAFTTWLSLCAPNSQTMLSQHKKHVKNYSPFYPSKLFYTKK